MRHIIAEYNFLESKMENDWDELLVGSSSSSWNSGFYIDMQVNNQNDKVIRQTKLYSPVKTNQYKKSLFTVALNTSDTTGFISRIGNFDDHNNKTALVNDVGGSGLFFEYKNNELYVGIRHGTIDNDVDILINQADFNTGIFQKDSDLIINGSKIHTFEISINNRGEATWSIYNDGDKIILHSIRDISILLNKLPTYNLPVRLEIEKVDTNAFIGNMKQYNTNTYYEYDYNIDTIERYNIKHLSPISGIKFNIDSNFYKPLFSLKLKDINIRNHISLYEILYLVDQIGPFSYAIIINPTFNEKSPVWVNSGSSYMLEYDISANSIDLNNMNVIHEQYINSTNSYIYDQKTALNSNEYLPIASNIIGESDIITIVARKMGPKFVTSYFNFRWV